MNETLNYWTPSGVAPARVLPPHGLGQDGDERIDWLTAGAFSIVIAMAWVMGG